MYIVYHRLDLYICFLSSFFEKKNEYCYHPSPPLPSPIPVPVLILYLYSPKEAVSILQIY